jgi:hypothetical protein
MCDVDDHVGDFWRRTKVVCGGGDVDAPVKCLWKRLRRRLSPRMNSENGEMLERSGEAAARGVEVVV